MKLNLGSSDKVHEEIVLKVNSGVSTKRDIYKWRSALFYFSINVLKVRLG